MKKLNCLAYRELSSSVFGSSWYWVRNHIHSSFSFSLNIWLYIILFYWKLPIYTTSVSRRILWFIALPYQLYKQHYIISFVILYVVLVCKSILFQSDGSINIYCNPNIFTTFLLLHTHWSRQGKKDNVPQFLRITA
jgi:hypothetical protein